MRAPWMLLWLAACSSPGPEPLDPPGADDTALTGDDDGGDPGHFDDAIPDPWEVMDPGYCATRPYYDPDWSVGTSWFVGDFRFKNGAWIGTETWVLYFNETAASALEIEACQVVWAVSATEQEPESCAACDFGLLVSANLDATATDCPEGLWIDDQSFTVGYDIMAHSDGTTSFLFASSGNPVGGWYWHGDRYTFLSSPSCMIF